MKRSGLIAMIALTLLPLVMTGLRFTQAQAAWIAWARNSARSR